MPLNFARRRFFGGEKNPATAPKISPQCLQNNTPAPTCKDMWHYLTEKMRAALENSHQLALESDNSRIEPPHLLFSVL
ncbi:MAG: hypothetical protein HAW59_00185, partial [Betaproteobacteria bacterium]|nr:hypothetical protein [Betaproteobacteria bacterium]